MSTGGTYAGDLWRDNEETFSTVESRLKQYTMANLRVKEANSVLIVGGGPTGIETAAFMKEKHPEKRVAICTRSNNLMNAYTCAEKGTSYLLPVLEKLGVEFMPGVPYTEDAQFAQEFDYVINCAGIRFEGPRKYMSGDLANCVEGNTGQIMCNRQCQVTDKHPFLPTDQARPITVHKNIFALGDAALLPCKEVKSIASLVQYVYLVSHNIDAFLTGGQMKQLPERLHELLKAATGSKDGFLQFNGMSTYIPNASIEKKDDAFGRMAAWRDFDQAAIDKWNGHPKKSTWLIDCVAGWSGCFCCCPCHICWNSNK